MRRAFFWLIPFLSILCFTNQSFAYSYAEAEDPMVIVFKGGLIAATDGDWDLVRMKSEEGISSQKGHLFEADELRPGFGAAIEKKDISKTAGLFANLVYISIREKLYRCMHNGLKDFKNDKARLSLARKSYIDALDGNVKKQDAKRSETILKQFDTALLSMGNPGLFGIGAEPADINEFKKAVENIEKQIKISFPDFFEGKSK